MPTLPSGSEFSTINEIARYLLRIATIVATIITRIIYNSCCYTLMYISIAVFYAALVIIDSKYLKALW